MENIPNHPDIQTPQPQPSLVSPSEKTSRSNNFLHYFLVFVYLSFGLWIINGIFEKNPFYDGTRLWYIIPGFVYLRPILMACFSIGSVLFFWRRFRSFAFGVLLLSILALLGYIYGSIFLR